MNPDEYDKWITICERAIEYLDEGHSRESRDTKMWLTIYNAAMAILANEG